MTTCQITKWQHFTFICWQESQIQITSKAWLFLGLQSVSQPNVSQIQMITLLTVEIFVHTEVNVLEGISAHLLTKRNYIFFKEKVCSVLASDSLCWRHDRTNMEKSSYCCCYSHGRFNTGERNFHLSKPHSSPHTEQHTSPLRTEAKPSISCNKNSSHRGTSFRYFDCEIQETGDCRAV